MKKLLVLLFLSATLLSCDEALEEIIDDIASEGESTATVTGNVTLEFNGVAEFFHSTIAAQNISTMSVTLTNGNDIEVLDFLLGDLASADGIQETTYHYNSDPDGNPQFVPKFVTEDDLYLVDVAVDDVNKITFTSIKDLKVQGNFELNLVNFDMEKVKITGSFEAVGLTSNL